MAQADNLILQFSLWWAGPLLMLIQCLGLVGDAEPSISYGVARTDLETRQAYLEQFSNKILESTALSVNRTNAWLTVLDEVPDGAWSRKN